MTSIVEEWLAKMSAALDVKAEAIKLWMDVDPHWAEYRRELVQLDLEDLNLIATNFTLFPYHWRPPFPEEVALRDCPADGMVFIVWVPDTAEFLRSYMERWLYERIIAQPDGPDKLMAAHMMGRFAAGGLAEVNKLVENYRRLARERDEMESADVLAEIDQILGTGE